MQTASGSVGIAEVVSAKVKTVENRIDVSVTLYLRFGVTVDPVIDSTRRLIKFNVEQFTGMTVDTVNIDVLGIKN